MERDILLQMNIPSLNLEEYGCPPFHRVVALGKDYGISHVNDCGQHHFAGERGKLHCPIRETSYYRSWVQQMTAHESSPSPPPPPGPPPYPEDLTMAVDQPLPVESLSPEPIHWLEPAPFSSPPSPPQEPSSTMSPGTMATETNPLTPSWWNGGPEDIIEFPLIRPSSST